MGVLGPDDQTVWRAGGRGEGDGGGTTESATMIMLAGGVGGFLEIKPRYLLNLLPEKTEQLLLFSCAEPLLLLSVILVPHWTTAMYPPRIASHGQKVRPHEEVPGPPR